MSGVHYFRGKPVYTDKESGEIKNSDAFSGAELLQIAQLATKAYNEVGEIRNSE